MTTRQEWGEYLQYVQEIKYLQVHDREELHIGSLSELHEMRSWTELLGVTEQQLRAAVAAVGNSAEKVRKHLGK